MEQDKIYRDQDLTIYKLSKLLGTNSKYVSMVINNYFEKTFVNFVNEYRINEAKINLVNKTYKIIQSKRMATKLDLNPSRHLI